LYWVVFARNLKIQNLFLLISSYLFYAFADWRFLIVLLLNSAANYYLGLAIYNGDSERKQKTLLRIGLFLGVGTLIYFKYTNFFIHGFTNLSNAIHLHTNLRTINLILPLGISFYTFRTLSYLLDIYYKKMQPTRNWVDFFCYASFFPEILSGPIDRARTFIPQLQKVRTFDYVKAVDGMRQILWGLFQKVVIADNCAPLVTYIFNNYKQQTGITLLLGAFYYAFQLYADFSGYSDMAIGIGKLLGFDLTRNFNFPFFSKNISDFWRKWHISLTQWLTDYVFTALTVRWRNAGKTGIVFSIIVTFIIIGAWHNANWTWIVFGGLNGLLFIPLILKGNILKGGVIAKGRSFPNFKEFLSMLGTFTAVMLLMVITRSSTIWQACDYLGRIFSVSLFTFPKVLSIKTISIIFIFIFIEWLQRDKMHGLQLSKVKSPIARLIIYYILIFAIILLNPGPAQETFIYFKF